MSIWCWHYIANMMTRSNGNIFRVTGHLCGEFIGPRWIPHTKFSDAEFWCFLWSVWINGWVNNREAGDLRRYRAHYDVTVMNIEHMTNMSNMPSLTVYLHDDDSEYWWRISHLHEMQMSLISGNEWACLVFMSFCHFNPIIMPPASTKLKGGYTGFTLSVRPSVRVWTESYPLCFFNNTHRIHFIFAHLIKQLQKVCLV